MKAIGYIRVSTQDQVSSGLGLENQRNKIKQFCSSKDIELIEIIEENGISGGIPIEERKEGSRLCEYIRNKNNKIGSVVMLNLERGFRDTEDCLHHAKEWIRYGVEINFLDMSGLDASTSMGMLQITMRAGFSEFERRQIGDRTRSALAVKRSRGEKTGGICPYGFVPTINRDGKQEVIGLVKKMRGMKMSPEKIAGKLNEAGIKPKAAGQTRKKKDGTVMILSDRWHFKQIYRLLGRK
jgi:site-specific DNA recombinase